MILDIFKSVLDIPKLDNNSNTLRLTYYGNKYSRISMKKEKITSLYLVNHVVIRQDNIPAKDLTKRAKDYQVPFFVNDVTEWN